MVASPHASAGNLDVARFRQVYNDEFHAALSQLEGAEPFEHISGFMCECDRERCFARIEATLREIEQVRAIPDGRLHHPAHDAPALALVERRARFAVWAPQFA